MFFKNKEDKLVKNAEEERISLNTEEEASSLNGESIGLAYTNPTDMPNEVKTNEVGSFAYSTIGAMSNEIKAKKEEKIRQEEIKIGSRWQHFKGNIVIVKGIVRHTESLEKLVIYEHDNELWARPISSFLDNEDISNRKDNKTGQKYRFVEIKERES